MTKAEKELQEKQSSIHIREMRKIKGRVRDWLSNTETDLPDGAVIRLTMSDGSQFDIEMFERNEHADDKPRLVIRSPGGAAKHRILIEPCASNTIILRTE